MKRIFLLIVLCVITLTWGISHAGIAGTKHDLTLGNPVSGGTGFAVFATQQVCVFCHTPHGSRNDISATTYWDGGASFSGPATGSFLLWNRPLSGPAPNGTGVDSFIPYNSPTFNSPSGQLNVYTLMCMGCHDGVGALNVVRNFPNDIPDPVNGPIPEFGLGDLDGIVHIGEIFDGTGFSWGPNIGEMTPSGGTAMHLENDHPVSINYNDALTADGPNAFNSVQGTAPNQYVGDPAVRLFPDPQALGGLYIECSTCHDVHNSPPGQEPFLVMSNTGSALCTSCHVK